MNPTIDTKELRRKISEAQFIRDNAVPVVTLTEDDARGLADHIDRLAADLAKAKAVVEKAKAVLQRFSNCAYIEDDDTNDETMIGSCVTAGMVRAARRTLAEIAP